jgi:hypothetical protein
MRDIQNVTLRLLGGLGCFNLARSLRKPTDLAGWRESDGASSQNVTHQQSQGNKILHLACHRWSHKPHSSGMPRFVFRAWVRDGNRLHRGLLEKSNVYHTNRYVVRVRNDHSEQVLAGNPAAEAPRARKFLMRVQATPLRKRLGRVNF